jgi:hypothetical protein
MDTDALNRASLLHGNASIFDLLREQFDRVVVAVSAEGSKQIMDVLWFDPQCRVKFIDRPVTSVVGCQFETAVLVV